MGLSLMLSATMIWLRSPPTLTSMASLMSSLELPSNRPRLTMEPASGTAPTLSTSPTAGSSTSTTTPMTPMATLPRSPTTALLPTLMSLSELVTVLSAMPSLVLLPSLTLSLWLALLPLHLTALLGMVSASVTVAPSLDKSLLQYLCIYQQ